MALVSIIVAHGLNREIGKDNDLMWSLPRDMKFFKETTAGHPVIMGRKNWESIPEKWRPLPGRKNIILSRTVEEDKDHIWVTNNLDAALDMAWEEETEEVFIIGGGQIYDLALKAGVVNRMYITHVNAEFSDAHTFFPTFDSSKWKQTSLLKHSIDEKHQFSFEVVQYDFLKE